jgi:hypothetical protein
MVAAKFVDRVETNLSIAVRRLLGRDPELGTVLRQLTFRIVGGSAPCRIEAEAGTGRLCLECSRGWLEGRSIEQMVLTLAEVARQLGRC